ncbi:hypothetical protein [Providencia manganoxydans]
MLAIDAIFGTELPQNPHFVATIKLAYQQILDLGVRQAVAQL